MASSIHFFLSNLIAHELVKVNASAHIDKILKFRKCETPLLEPARAKVSPFPEGRDLGRGYREQKMCVGLTAFVRVITLK